jgi:hypothetical protein
MIPEELDQAEQVKLKGRKKGLRKDFQVEDKD